MAHLLPSYLLPWPGSAGPTPGPSYPAITSSHARSGTLDSALPCPPLGMPASLPHLCLLRGIRVQSLSLSCSLSGSAGSSLLSIISLQPFSHVYFLSCNDRFHMRLITLPTKACGINCHLPLTPMLFFRGRILKRSRIKSSLSRCPCSEA